MAEENNTPEQAKAEKKDPAKPAATAAKAKKAKPPKLEDKPFAEFIQEHYLPSLQEAMSEQGIDDLELTFVQQDIAVKGMGGNQPCWQVVGKWQTGDRQFNIYFPDEDISGQKAFSCATYGNSATLLESFMIDERRVTLELLVLYTIQRLNAQKWLTGN